MEKNSIKKFLFISRSHQITQEVTWNILEKQFQESFQWARIQLNWIQVPQEHSQRNLLFWSVPFFFLSPVSSGLVCLCCFSFFFQQGTTYANNIKQNSIFSSHHYSVGTEMGKGTTRPFTFPSLLNSFLRWCKAINSLQSIDSSGLHFLQGTH